MDAEQTGQSADAPSVAVPSFAELTGETPAVATSPPQDQGQGRGQPAEAAPQIDWDAEKTRWEAQLAEREQQLQRVMAERDRVAQAAQQVVAADAAKQRQDREAQLDAQLDAGDITAQQYRAEMRRAVDEERRQMQAQFEAASLPYMVRDYAQQAGLTPEELTQLENVPPQAVDWTIQRIIADRQTKNEWAEKFAQLEKSVQAQGVVQQGVTRGVSGVAGGASQEFAPDDHLGRLRAALSGLGHAELIGARQ